MRPLPRRAAFFYWTMMFGDASGMRCSGGLSLRLGSVGRMQSDLTTATFEALTSVYSILLRKNIITLRL
jgi:hypothetical protein